MRTDAIASACASTNFLHLCAGRVESAATTNTSGALCARRISRPPELANWRRVARRPPNQRGGVGSVACRSPVRADSRPLPPPPHLSAAGKSRPLAGSGGVRAKCNDCLTATEAPATTETRPATGGRKHARTHARAQILSDGCRSRPEEARQRKRRWPARCGRRKSGARRLPAAEIGPPMELNMVASAPASDLRARKLIHFGHGPGGRAHLPGGLTFVGRFRKLERRCVSGARVAFARNLFGKNTNIVTRTSPIARVPTLLAVPGPKAHAHSRRWPRLCPRRRAMRARSRL